MAEPSDPLTFRAVDRDGWPDLETLFSGSGWPKTCWCMAWRATAEERRAASAARAAQPEGSGSAAALVRKEGLRRRVLGGVPVGLIGYDGEGNATAWVSIAPRPSYRALGGPKDFADDPDRVWSLACFFIPRRKRGRGWTRQMIAAAVDYARANGATVVEAYPVEPDSPSFRFMGFVPAFAAAGFARVGQAGSRRSVMRLALAP